MNYQEFVRKGAHLEIADEQPIAVLYDGRNESAAVFRLDVSKDVIACVDILRTALFQNDESAMAATLVEYGYLLDAFKPSPLCEIVIITNFAPYNPAMAEEAKAQINVALAPLLRRELESNGMAEEGTWETENMAIIVPLDFLKSYVLIPDTRVSVYEEVDGKLQEVSYSG